MSDRDAEGNFICSTGVSLDEDVSMWANYADTSSHYGQDCVYMLSDLKKLKLAVGDCEQSMQYLCQYATGG